jgi:hypothetical protein
MNQSKKNRKGNDGLKSDNLKSDRFKREDGAVGNDIKTNSNSVNSEDVQPELMNQQSKISGGSRDSDEQLSWPGRAGEDQGSSWEPSSSSTSAGQGRPQAETFTYDSSESSGADTAAAKGTGIFGDAVKKLFTAGVSAAFMTEESIRGFVSEMKLPKETLNLILTGASKSKDEIVSRAGAQLTAMISKIDLVSEVGKFVETHKFKVQMEIEVLPKEKKPDSSQS